LTTIYSRERFHRYHLNGKNLPLALRFLSSNPLEVERAVFPPLLSPHTQDAFSPDVFCFFPFFDHLVHHPDDGGILSHKMSRTAFVSDAFPSVSPLCDFGINFPLPFLFAPLRLEELILFYLPKVLVSALRIRDGSFLPPPPFFDKFRQCFCSLSSFLGNNHPPPTGSASALLTRLQVSSSIIFLCLFFVALAFQRCIPLL